MSESAVFAWMCEALEASTDLSRLEARGTVRLALKAAGLSVEALTRSQAGVVLERVMPGELSSRGLAEAARICERLGIQLKSARLDDAAAVETPGDAATVSFLIAPSSSTAQALAESRPGSGDPSGARPPTPT